MRGVKGKEREREASWDKETVVDLLAAVWISKSRKGGGRKGNNILVDVVVVVAGARGAEKRAFLTFEIENSSSLLTRAEKKERRKRKKRSLPPNLQTIDWKRSNGPSSKEVFTFFSYSAHKIITRYKRGAKEYSPIKRRPVYRYRAEVGDNSSRRGVTQWYQREQGLWGRPHEKAHSSSFKFPECSLFSRFFEKAQECKFFTPPTPAKRAFLLSGASEVFVL